MQFNDFSTFTWHPNDFCHANNRLELLLIEIAADAACITKNQQNVFDRWSSSISIDFPLLMTSDLNSSYNIAKSR